MNERIHTLAREAGLIAPHGSDREGLRDFDYRMFARLIVRECAELMYGRDENGNCKDGDVIKQHFGVEE